MGASRAELRRRAAGAVGERPDVVWGRQIAEQKTGAATAVAADAPVAEQPVHDVAVDPKAAPAPASLEISATPVPVIEPVVPAPAVRNEQPAAEQPAPLTRRARRAAARPAIPVPPIAPVAPAEPEPERPAAALEAELPSADAPAPLLEPVLAPAEPFQLIAPEAEPADDRAETEAAVASVIAATAALAVVAEAAAADLAAPAADRPDIERLEALTGPVAQVAASDVDEFEAAARLFSFTGETPVQEAPAAPARPDATHRVRGHHAPRRAKAEPAAAAAPAPARAPRVNVKRLATASFSVGVIGIVGLMAVGMTTPAQAVAAASGEASMSIVAGATAAKGTQPAIEPEQIQAYVAPAGIEPDALDRSENYGTTTMAEIASEAGIQNFSNLFHNDPNSNIQWPFAVGVTMSYGFGMRSGRMHEGIDFTPGAGSPVQAIADGVVREATESGGAYGVTVVIDHVIDGQLVSSRYAHMLYGSLQVVPGQHVTVGTVLGKTGDTGRSFGAHTHFEILQGGTTAIDPWPWLVEHTDRTHTVG